MSTPPSYIFASTRTRREFPPRHGGPALFVIAVLLLLFWGGVGVGTAILLGAL